MDSLLIVGVATATVAYGAVSSLRIDQLLHSDMDKDDILTHIPQVNGQFALILPLVGSIMLVSMYYLFAYVSFILTVVTLGYAFVALVVGMSPLVAYLVDPCGFPQIRTPCPLSSCFLSSHVSASMIVNISLSATLCLAWIVSGHWFLNDAMAVCLCVMAISFVRLPSLRVAVFVMSALLVFDVVWVFLSPFVFGNNVMVEVAMKRAINPARVVAGALRLPPSWIAHLTGELQLPNKIMVPSDGGFSILGLGDIVLPGLFVAFALRVDDHLQSASSRSSPNAVTQAVAQGPRRAWETYFYFTYCLIGYVIGLVGASVCSHVFEAPMPALLFLVPSTLVAMAAAGWWRSQLAFLWIGLPTLFGKRSSDEEDPLKHALT